MPIVETKIDIFDGGITNDPRDRRKSTCRMVSNFNIITNPRKMSPYRDSEDGHSGATTQQPRNFLVALRSGTLYRLFALSRQTSLNRVHIQMKDLTMGAAQDLDDNGWATPLNNEGNQNTPAFGLFVYYRRTARIYGTHTGTHIWSFDPSSSAAFDNTNLALNYTNIAQGLVHSKDDVLYVPYDNKIAKNDNGTWTSIALQLPDHFYITSIAEMGNNIAIAMAPLSGAQVGQSRVFIWDRDTSLTTLSETIPWEEGQLQILDVVDGYLIGVTLSGNSTTRFSNRIIFRYLTGNNIMGYRAEKLFEILSSNAGTTTLPIAKQMVDGRLHFMMRAYIDGTQRDGVWSIGKLGESFTLNHERAVNNDTALGNGILHNFMYVGDYLFQAYQNTASDFAVSKTIDTATFTSQTAIYETSIFDGSLHNFDASYPKNLKEITVTTEFLPAAGQVLLGYRINEQTAWTTIFVNTTDNSISHTAINFESRTATMTIASPAVVTLTAHGLLAGDSIYFTTTGALPTGVSANTTYYVISAGLATDSFRFSASSGGSAVNTSGSQSGTHTLYRANDALPNDYKEIHFRIESTGNAEITSLIFKEEIKPRKYEAA